MKPVPDAVLAAYLEEIAGDAERVEVERAIAAGGPETRRLEKLRAILPEEGGPPALAEVALPPGLLERTLGRLEAEGLVRKEEGEARVLPGPGAAAALEAGTVLRASGPGCELRTAARSSQPPPGEEAPLDVRVPHLIALAASGSRAERARAQLELEGIFETIGRPGPSPLRVLTDLAAFRQPRAEGVPATAEGWQEWWSRVRRR